MSAEGSRIPRLQAWGAIKTQPISPFNWQNQPTTIQLGRVKSKRQIVIDATRVNPEQHSCTPNQTKSKVAPR